MSNPLLRKIPSVAELLESPPLRQLVDKVSHNVVVSEVRSFLDDFRADLQKRAAAVSSEIKIPAASELAERIAQWIHMDQRPPLRPVVNATGVLLHTGLGRAPLAEEALAEMQQIARGYSSLEVDLDTGQRSRRVRAVERLLCELTGAEAACVVNNNAGATVLVLAALARDREVIVSRGQLVEIGGSFRLPEVMATSGAILREVGTTNKTRITDFEQAITDRSGALLRVHCSNFRIVGFTEEPTLQQLVALGRKRQLPVIDDIGSGALIDFSRFGLPGEPMASESVKAGVEVALFSGDKLLGGPQCGIIIGRSESIRRMEEHPLMRAFRVDKLTLGALAATLRLYRDPERALARIPLLALLATPSDNLRNRAERLAPQIGAAPAVAAAEPVADLAYLGGGSIPTQRLETWCIAITPRGRSSDALARGLRLGSPAVFGRIQQERLFLDLRTVSPEQDEVLVKAVAQIGGETGKTADATTSSATS